MTAEPRTPVVRAVSAVIRGYRMTLSPLLGSTCRFHPTCSQYALDALARHGALRGTWLAIRRIGRCHPFADGGTDHVPAEFRWWGRAATPPAESSGPSEV